MAKLIVEVLNARDLLPSDHHGSASPFVQVEFNGHSQHTQTRTRDLYPTWNENLVFDIENPRNLIQVILYDDHRGNHHKGFLGCVRISGASVSLLESEASVRQYPLCKQDSFSHGRGDISLKIYTIRAQYFFGNQQPHSHLNNRKAPKPEGSTKHDDKYKGGDKRRGEENETRNVYSSQTSGGIIMRKDRTNTSSSVYFSPALCYLRLGVIEARHLAPLDSNRQPELFVMVTLENPRIVVRTRTFRVIDRNPVWKEDFILVVSEKIRCNNLIVDVFDRINKFREEFIGRTVVPLNAIPERSDSTVPLKVRWFSLNGVSSDDERIKRKKQGKILPGLCLETGYHVSDGSRSGFQPFAKHMRKDSIGNLELQILNARGLPPMKKQIEGGRTSTDAYCVAKYGNKWVRTRTIVNSREPHWNEHYAWEVYDPCTEIRICILDDCQKDHRDARMGRVCIQLQTLEANRNYTQYYPLLVLTPSGLKNIGELQVAVRFTCVAWANMVAKYAKPLLPKMNYLLPLDPSQLDILRHNTVKAVESSLTKAMPHIKKEVVHYMLDPGSCMCGA